MSDITREEIDRRTSGTFRQVSEKEKQCAVVLERTVMESVPTVWAALTEPDRLARWYGPVEGTVASGSTVRFPRSGAEATIEICDHHRFFNLAWDPQNDGGLVQVSLTKVQEGTVLTLRHTLPRNQHWDQYGPAAVGLGWDGMLLALSFYLQGDDRLAPEDQQAFSAGEEGRAFTKRSAEAWKDAHVKAGADELKAEQAARQSYEAYTQA